MKEWDDMTLEEKVEWAMMGENHLWHAFPRLCNLLTRLYEEWCQQKQRIAELEVNQVTILQDKTRQLDTTNKKIAELKAEIAQLKENQK